MNTTTLSTQNHTQLPWHLSGEGYILNYWLSPLLIRSFQPFGLAESRFGRLVQVMLVRYHTSPIGPYDELLFLDHAFTGLKMHSNIPKIYVSSQSSVVEGRYHWGIPKELAQFEWGHTAQHLSCRITHENETLSIKLNLFDQKHAFAVSSQCVPSQFLNIKQQDQHFLYQFSPSFKGRLAYLSQATWTNTQNIFPDLSQATFLKGFYSTDFHLIFPEAIKSELISK